MKRERGREGQPPVNGMVLCILTVGLHRLPAQALVRGHIRKHELLGTCGSVSSHSLKESLRRNYRESEEGAWGR